MRAAVGRVRGASEKIQSFLDRRERGADSPRFESEASKKAWEPLRIFPAAGGRGAISLRRQWFRQVDAAH